MNLLEEWGSATFNWSIGANYTSRIIGLIKGKSKCNSVKFFQDSKAVDARSHVLINVFPRQKRMAARRGGTRSAARGQRKSRGSPSSLLWRNGPALWGARVRLCTPPLRQCKSRSPTRTRPWNKALSLANEPSGTPEGRRVFHQNLRCISRC